MPSPALKGYFLFAVVILIGFLMLGNIYLTYQNALIIRDNKKLQEETESIKLNMLHIIRGLNLTDLGLRGHALVKNRQIEGAIDRGIVYTQDAFKQLEIDLENQNYPMEEFLAFRDSVTLYFSLVEQMRSYIQTDQQEKFLEMLSQDRGYNVWLQYRKISDNVYAFEKNFSAIAKSKYDAALGNIYMLQILLFLIALPTLVYTAYHANRALVISNRLQKVEKEKNKILEDQNQALERMVQERTNEIRAQNEEIAAHNEQLLLQQEEIENQKRIIEEQSNLIRIKNEALTIEVERQMQDLKKTNLELVEQNNRLEQFAYIISHNLRAPMARLVGLASVLEIVKNKEESSKIIQLMVNTTSEFDNVIKDLSQILSIKNLNTHVLEEIDLEELLNKALAMLEPEIKATRAKVIRDFRGAQMIYSLPQYIESIFYNLISNSIKYRFPNRPPVIKVTSRSENEYYRIEISDNGLGIDLQKHKNNIFSLYKRFHFHVEGKGLGLYLVKTQLDALGGKIEAKSKIDEGTTFILFLKKVAG